jgi:hypothetical protein
LEQLSRDVMRAVLVADDRDDRDPVKRHHPSAASVSPKKASGRSRTRRA